MFSANRRRFLRQVSTAGIACSANCSSAVSCRPRLRLQNSSDSAGSTLTRAAPWLRSIAICSVRFSSIWGAPSTKEFTIPARSLSDSNGFRKDVMDEIRQMGVPIIRYPGGNFVSGYNWLDGVGPKQDRPRVLDKAWNSLNTNQFGTNEFMAWCKAVGTQPLMGLNLGTGTPEQAAALVEYCNVDKGTKWSDLRRKNGYAEPYNVKHWCLGNEMDGPWQIGHMTATEYGLKAQDAARQMRRGGSFAAS